MIVSPDDVVVGRGFHPLAGYPHAEVFALMEASGKVTCGRMAACGVLMEEGGVQADKLGLTEEEEKTAREEGTKGEDGRTDRTLTKMLTLTLPCWLPCSDNISLPRVLEWRRVDVR